MHGPGRLGRHAAGPGPGAGLPAARQADPHHRALPGRWADRHPGPRTGAQAAGVAGGAGDRRQQARRVHLHRHPGPGARRARRPHGHVHHRRDGDAEPAPLQQAALRPGQGPGAGDVRRALGHHPGGAGECALQQREGAGGLCQGQPGQAEFRVVFQRVHLAPVRRADEGGRWHRHGAHPVQGQRRRRHRADRQPGAIAVRRPHHRDLHGQGRPRQDAGRHRQGPLRCGARGAHHGRGRRAGAGPGRRHDVLCAGQDPARDHPEDQRRTGQGTARPGGEGPVRQRRHRDRGVQPRGPGRAVRRGSERWGAIIKKLGIKLD